MEDRWGEIGPLINHTLWLVRRQLATPAAEHGITVPQAVALVAVIRAEATGVVLTPSALADRLAIERSAVSIILARLERARWVVTTTQEHDRRSRTLALTDAGREIARHMDGHVRAVWRDSMADVTEAETDCFVSVLERMSARLEGAVQARLTR